MSAFLPRYLALTVKEVQQLLRNRGLLIQSLVPPFYSESSSGSR